MAYERYWEIDEPVTIEDTMVQIGEALFYHAPDESEDMVLYVGSFTPAVSGHSEELVVSVGAWPTDGVTNDGQPGDKYYNNRVRLRASVDFSTLGNPFNGTVKGTVRIVYEHVVPDAE